MKDVKDNIMFHYFYDSVKHSFIHGALDSARFEELVTVLLEKKKLINASEWLDRFKNNKVEGKVAFTFDDGLLSQYDIAYPILKKNNINAFWFVNSAPFNNTPINMELFRRFKHEYFKNPDDYYDLFFKQYEVEFKKSIPDAECENYLSNYSFYTFNDRKYRYIRDLLLTQDQYEELVLKMIKTCNWPMQDYISKIWLNKVQLKELSDSGHCIGLHTHSHPINFKRLNKKEQLREYESNQNAIIEITGKKSTVMAHPINSYNSDTLNVLKDLGVRLGFCSTNKLQEYSDLELPRIDHTLVNY